MAAILALIAIAAYWWWPLPKTEAADPRIVEMFETTQKPLIEKLLSANSTWERLQLAGQLQQSLVKLDDQDRRLLFEHGRKNADTFRQAFMTREQQRVEKFFQLSPEQQKKALDEHIDEMESFRKLFAGFGRPPGDGAGPPKAPSNSSGPTSQEFREFQRQLGFQKMLNDTTPQFRAEVTEYMSRMSQRREERGLPAMPMPGL